MRSLVSFLFLASVLCLAGTAPAQDIRIPLPKKSKYTPVQQLNRDGVHALEKHDIAKAKGLFYKAYLIDPDDPFTLNNLGYVAELEGDLDRAQRYYDQAKANTSEAVIDKATSKQVEGKPVAKIAGDVSGKAVSLNQLNSEAVRLLKEGVTVVIFPAGGVATAPKGFGRAIDLPWKMFPAKLVQDVRAATQQ